MQKPEIDWKRADILIRLALEEDLGDLGDTTTNSVIPADLKTTAVLGTHTHVQTADARILPGGTAFLSDVGMVGAADSILGRSVPDVIAKFRTGMPHKFPVVESGIRLDAAVIRYDMLTGKALEIKPVSVMYDTQSVP